jgi:hypothetical protein
MGTHWELRKTLTYKQIILGHYLIFPSGNYEVSNLIVKKNPHLPQVGFNLIFFGSLSWNGGHPQEE